MRLVWELIRVAWAVGCLPIGALLLVVLVLTGFNLPFFLRYHFHNDQLLLTIHHTEKGVFRPDVRSITCNQCDRLNNP